MFVSWFPNKPIRLRTCLVSFLLVQCDSCVVIGVHKECFVNVRSSCARERGQADLRSRWVSFRPVSLCLTSGRQRQRHYRSECAMAAMGGDVMPPPVLLSSVFLALYVAIKNIWAPVSFLI